MERKNRKFRSAIGLLAGILLLVCALFSMFAREASPSGGAEGGLSYRTTADAGFYSMGTGGSQLVGGQKSKFTMGKYGASSYKTADGIPWLVLDVVGDQALVLSEYLADPIQYNANYDSPKYGFWSNSNVRAYLNGGQAYGSGNAAYTATNSFYGSSFSDAEKTAIATSTIVSQKYYWNGSAYVFDQGSQFNDYLNGTKVYKYMPNSASPAPTGQETAGAYASGKETTVDKLFLLDYNDVARGWSNADSNATKYGFAETAQAENGTTPADASRIAKLANGGSASYWWLRGSGCNNGNGTGLRVKPSGDV